MCNTLLITKYRGIAFCTLNSTAPAKPNKAIRIISHGRQDPDRDDDSEVAGGAVLEYPNSW